MLINMNSELALLRAALERSGEGYMRLDRQGVIVHVNAAMGSLFKADAETLLGRNAIDLFVDHERATDERVLTRTVFTDHFDRSYAYELTAVRLDDTRFPAEILFAGNDENGVHQWLVRDISEKRELHRLRLSDERYKQGQSFAGIGTWDWLIDTDVVHWSEDVAPMFGLPKGTQPTYALFCEAVHPDDRERMRENEIACVKNNQRHDVEYRVQWPNGTIRWLRETGNLLRDADGKALRMVGVVRDITDQKENEQRYKHMAQHDTLTGLPNRGLFEQRLDLAIKRTHRHDMAVGLLFIDLGKFKSINDTFGHLTGDKVLVSVSERLKKAVRQTDLVARLGGDEFVVIMEDVHNEGEIEMLARKLIDTLTQPMPIDGHTHIIGASIGAALGRGQNQDAQDLIHRADMAMYEAKHQAGNQFVLAK